MYIGHFCSFTISLHIQIFDCSSSSIVHKHELYKQLTIYVFLSAKSMKESHRFEIFFFFFFQKWPVNLCCHGVGKNASFQKGHESFM